MHPLNPTIRQRQQRLTLPTIALGKKLGLKHGDALYIVDVQQDFLPGGALAVPDGDAVIQPLNAYIAAFESRRLPIFLSRDWHPENHCSFKEAGGRWPAHCVRKTPGADWPTALHVPLNARVISKATEPGAEAYSGFTGTSLAAVLHDLDVRRLFVGGLATDYCVHDTVLAARALGFDVIVLADAIRGINTEPGDETRAIREMLQQGASLFERSKVFIDRAQRELKHRTKANIDAGRHT